MTQTEQVLKHFINDGKGNGHLTQMEALSKYGIMRLASRISDLNGSGFNIVSDRIIVLNRYGEPCKVAEYRLGYPAALTEGARIIYARLGGLTNGRAQNVHEESNG